jgi:inner membrane protein
MDSLSQLVLGAACTAACVPAAHRRAALAAGAFFGTLPDLDIIPLALLDLDAVQAMTWHRAASHSLFLLPVAGWLIWLALKRWWQPVGSAPRGWLWGIQLALITHPLLDALTIYGTQLWWPLRPSPVMTGSLFIIDPLYTLPLLIACIVTAFNRSRRAVVIGLALSTAYIGWSLAAQAYLHRLAERDLAALNLADAPRFATPAPLNTLLWRVVALTPDGYVEGHHSLVADRKPIQFTRYTSDNATLAAVAEMPAVRELRWFNRGFMKAEVRAGRLVLSDLRMGAEPDYIFSFAVAGKTAAGTWSPITPEPAAWASTGNRLAGVWTRLWHEP